MSRKAPSPFEIEYRVLDQLQSHDGSLWTEACGEYQGAYGELAIWILLAEAGDIGTAHTAFRDIILAYQHLVRFTVSYSVRTPEGEVLLDFFDGSDEIASAGLSRPFAAHPELKCSRSSVFRS